MSAEIELSNGAPDTGTPGKASAVAPAAEASEKEPASFLARGASRAAQHMRAALAPCAPVMMEWSDINLVVDVPAHPEQRRIPCTRVQTAEKHILRNISGRVFPGEMVAIMGASYVGLGARRGGLRHVRT
jgi:hypothetical protein